MKPDRNAPLTDASIFPFGKHHMLRHKMMDVPMKYLRWFLGEPWAAEWPAVVAFARERTGQRKQNAEAAIQKPVNNPAAPPRSDPKAASAAFEEFKKLKETL